MIKQLEPNDVFVFGSNLAGRHGAGAAKWAVDNAGAIYGQGIGLQGQSYGIPTKDFNIKPMPLSRILRFVNEFLEFARKHPEKRFLITRIGCGLAGYKDSEIGPMWKNVPRNCVMPKEWTQWVEYAGTALQKAE